MTDLQAAIGREQLKKIDFFLERREEIFQKYLRAGFDLMRNKNEHLKDVRYRAVVNTKKPIKMINALSRKGVRSIIPIEESEMPNVKSFPQAYALTKNLVSLPIYPTLSDKYVDLIISVVKRYI
jgi:dTDP-4-amino-4,6-dideoxygalactose transaminase